MPNMNPKKNEMPTRDPHERNRDFFEVTTGYTAEQAADEAERCLNCKTMPCVSGCPVNVHIPEFIEQIRKGVQDGKVYLPDKSLRKDPENRNQNIQRC